MTTQNGYYKIRSAAVVGSGTMGSGIAALLAGVGIPVKLYDIVPRELTGAEAAAGLTLESPAVRYRIVNDNIAAYKNARPPALYLAEDKALITACNLDDDFDALGEVDWVIEVIVENLKIKQGFFEKLDAIRKPGQIVTSNTSGIPIHALAEGRSDDFRKHFLGTHFFNPPRYLKLLELIPSPDTDRALVEFFRQFGAQRLGKGIVLCKDTPNFIANRIGIASNTFRMNYAMELGLTVEQTDAIAGPPMGYPKTAVFRLLDLVGLDLVAMINANSARVLSDPIFHQTGAKGSQVVATMIEQGWLGNKTNVGFYKMVRDKDGGKAFWPLDVDTMTHVEPGKVRFDSVGATRKISDLGERLRAWVQHEDKAAQYAWHTLAFSWSYSAERIPEIADTVYAIDDAMRWGWGVKAGPFETWDMLGVAGTIERMEADGYAVADWVKQMLAKGHASFYRDTPAGREAYSPLTGAYEPLPVPPTAISVGHLRSTDRELAGNDEASLFDMGDGVLLLEFHGKANTIGDGVGDMIEEALDRFERDPQVSGMVIGNEGDLFSAGANLDMQKFMSAGEPPAVLVERMTRRFQDLFMRIRYADKPVVAAPFDRVLGGGTEISLSSARIVAHMDLYMGLVEVGVGIIPGWGGCKEMLRRVVNPHMRIENADPLPPLQKVLMQIGTAKVSMGAKEAREIGFLQPTDRIVMDRDQLLGEAKREVLHLACSGYAAPVAEKIYAAGRDILSAARVSIWQMEQGGYISAHDRLITEKLAQVLTGGDLSAPTWVDEQYILDMERAALVELIQTPKSLERMMHLLQTGKPLRN